jgi:hypothetical protein
MVVRRLQELFLASKARSFHAHGIANGSCVGPRDQFNTLYHTVVVPTTHSGTKFAFHTAGTRVFCPTTAQSGVKFALDASARGIRAQPDSLLVLEGVIVLNSRGNGRCRMEISFECTERCRSSSLAARDHNSVTVWM